MPVSLYEATIPSFRQLLAATEGLVDKAAAHCAASGLAPETLIQARFAEDMLPFAYQVKSAKVHSIGAIEGVRAGSFSPDRTDPPESFDELKALLAGADAELGGIDPAEMEDFIGRPMRFVVGDRRLDFTADQFLLSFSQPNFYFHVTTAYDLLRSQGVELGKRDYLGRVRTLG